MSLVSSLTRSVGALRAGTRAFGSSAFPQYIINAPATEMATLNNGVRVATEGGHGETATVGVYIDAGSRDETERNNGVAHFLEHLNFKGTGKRSQTSLEMEFENMGGHLNAYTSREQTVYFAKVFKKDVPKAVELLADILQNSEYDSDAVNRERGVILREMEEVSKQQEEVIFDRLHETAYQGTGLGRTILGPVQNIQSITRDDLTSFVKNNYTGPRVVIAGAGAVEHQQLVDLGEKHFGKLPKVGESSVSRLSDKAVFTGSEIRHREDTIPFVHTTVAFETGGWTDPDSIPLMVMQTLLGNFDRASSSGVNLSSRLCRKIAEDNLAHSVMTFNTTYKDTGLFGVYTVAPPVGLQDLHYVVMFELTRLAYEVTEEEVERAKTQLKMNVLSQLDGSTAICEDIGRQVLTYGRRMTPAEIFARIDAIDVQAIKDAGSRFIQDKDIAVASIGNTHELPDYNWLRRRTYWYRY